MAKEKSPNRLNLEDVRHAYMSAVTMLCLKAKYAHQTSKEEMAIAIENVKKWHLELGKRFNAPDSYDEE